MDDVLLFLRSLLLCSLHLKWKESARRQSYAKTKPKTFLYSNSPRSNIIALASRLFSIRCAYISINVSLNVSESFDSTGGGCVISSAFGSASTVVPDVVPVGGGSPIPVQFSTLT